ncbi:MAG: hypothetical protein IIB39_08600 [Candidatus Marinimicrobia bacterium]|nr:hypothetical protein [Candidatus Neomarinimicrobiota bacterium]
MRIYVTNLRSEVTDDDLRKLFETHGKVISAEIVKTLTTNESTGLGFVEMESSADALSVRKELDGKLLNGNPIKIYDRRINSDRRDAADRRGLDVRRALEERRLAERRKKSGEEELVSMFDELDRRESEEQRITERRFIDERRMGDRRAGIERRRLGA